MNLKLAALTLSLLLPSMALAAVPADATCTGTLAGAVRAEFACDVQATYDEKTVTIVISAVDQVPGVKSLEPLVVKVAYPLAIGSYTLATIADGQSQATLASGETYQAKGARGEITLSVDAIERYSTPRRRYNIKGVLSARLAPVAGAKGELHLELRF